MISEEAPRSRLDTWIGAAIVILAAVLRLLWLGEKPAHFDEGVNGWFVDAITSQGYYHYDPANFHGPLHFYALFVSQTLFGREIWALRLPVALVSTASVALLLAFRSHFPRRACLIAALAAAVSPGMVFYGRDAIHESWLVLFLLATMWGILGLWRDGGRRHLWAAGLGCAGMVLTKETYVIHVAALALAAPCLVFWEKISPSAPLPIARQRWTREDFTTVAAVCVALIVFLYTGGLLDWPRVGASPAGSLAGLWETFALWTRTGIGGETGHEKEWHFWIELLARYEWPALLALVVTPFLLEPRSNRLARYVAIYATGALLAYTLIDYKTPWCLISVMWPFHLLLGVALYRAFTQLDRVLPILLGVAAGAHSIAAACQLTFRDFANEDEPYAYVQTLPEIDKLLVPLRTLVRQDPANYHLTGRLLTTDHHPLPWLLGDFTRIELGKPEDLAPPLDADFVLIDDAHVEQAEAVLTDTYFKEPLRIRGNAAESSVLYLRVEKFRVCFPGREPEFAP